MRHFFVGIVWGANFLCWALFGSFINLVAALLLLFVTIYTNDWYQLGKLRNS